MHAWGRFCVCVFFGRRQCMRRSAPCAVGLRRRMHACAGAPCSPAHACCMAHRPAFCVGGLPCRCRCVHASHTCCGLLKARCKMGGGGLYYWGMIAMMVTIPVCVRLHACLAVYVCGMCIPGPPCWLLSSLLPGM